MSDDCWCLLTAGVGAVSAVAPFSLATARPLSLGFLAVAPVVGFFLVFCAQPVWALIWLGCLAAIGALTALAQGWEYLCAKLRGCLCPNCAAPLPGRAACTKTGVKVTFTHSDVATAPPEEGWRTIWERCITQRYLQQARAGCVRSVSLVGDTRVGKTVWMNERSRGDEDEKRVAHVRKLMEELSPGRKLALVYLFQGHIPRECYEHFPRVALFEVPLPSTAEREAASRPYGIEKEQLSLHANLTDGLSLTETRRILATIVGQWWV